MNTFFNINMVLIVLKYQQFSELGSSYQVIGSNALRAYDLQTKNTNYQ